MMNQNISVRSREDGSVTTLNGDGMVREAPEEEVSQKKKAKHGKLETKVKAGDFHDRIIEKNFLRTLLYMASWTYGVGFVKESCSR